MNSWPFLSQLAAPSISESPGYLCWTALCHVGAPRDDETGDETHLVMELGNVSSHCPVLSTVNLKKITVNLKKKKKKKRFVLFTI